MSLPRATLIFPLFLLKISESITSRKKTVLELRRGISIPTAAFPGMGASIRISLDARAREMSSARLTILLILVPGAGEISYLVRIGPFVILTTLAVTPNVLKTSSRSLGLCRSLFKSIRPTGFKSSKLGNCHSLSVGLSLGILFSCSKSLVLDLKSSARRVSNLTSLIGKFTEEQTGFLENSFGALLARLSFLPGLFSILLFTLSIMFFSLK